MRRKQFLFSVVLLALVLSVALNGCKKDNGPSNLSLVSLKVGTIDLNGAVSPSNIPANPTITATFNTNVDAATATNANITLKRSYDGANIPLNISVASAVVTIAPTAGAIGNGALFTLTITTGVQSTGKLMLLAELDRSFTTVGTFVPTGQVAHWSFESNAIDSVGNYNPISGGIIDVTYAASRNAAAGMAAQFNGTTSLIEIANGDLLMNTTDFTLAFWAKEDSSQHDQFVMGLAAWYGFQFEINNDFGASNAGECKLAAQYSNVNDTSNSQDLWFNGAATNSTKDNGGWKGWTYCKDLTTSGGLDALIQNKWAHFVATYNSTTKLGTIYVNGTKMKEQDFNLYGPPMSNSTGLIYNGNPGNKQFVFGFIQDKTSPTITDSWADYNVTTNSHYKGLLDDVRIFHRALTSVEVGLIYNSEKP